MIVNALRKKICYFSYKLFDQILSNHTRFPFLYLESVHDDESFLNGDCISKNVDIDVSADIDADADGDDGYPE